MEEQMKLLWTKMKEEIEKQNMIQTKVIAENFSKTLEEHLAPIKLENERLKSEVLTLKSKIKLLDIEGRKNNIILYGIEETERNSAEMKNMVLGILNKSNGNQKNVHDWDIWEINKIYRIGKKVENGKRPIKIGFTLQWRRNEVLKNRKYLPKGIYVSEDLTREELEANKTLLPKIKEAKEAGKYAFVKNGKLIIKDKIEPAKRKRAPSSPPSTPPNNFSRLSDVTTQPARKFTKGQESDNKSTTKTSKN